MLKKAAFSFNKFFCVIPLNVRHFSSSLSLRSCQDQVALISLNPFSHCSSHAASFHVLHLREYSSSKLFLKPNHFKTPPFLFFFAKSVVSSSSSSVSPSTQPIQVSSEKQKSGKRLFYWQLFGIGCILSTSLLVLFLFGKPDDDGTLDEFSSMPMWQGYALRAFYKLYSDVSEPSREKLLPDPLSEPYYQPPYTLVFETNGILVHPDWTYATGWRFKKRPGVQSFLQNVAPPLFETVVFTSESGMTAFSLVDSLDPSNTIMYRLFRDSTLYKGGTHIKDLSHLNRDLSKVIFIDWDEKACSLQPDNCLKIKKWDGNDDDTALFDLAALCREIAMNNVKDVRDVIRFYNSQSDALDYFRQKKIEDINEEEALKEMQKSKDKTKTFLQTYAPKFSGSIFS